MKVCSSARERYIIKEAPTKTTVDSHIQDTPQEYSMYLVPTFAFFLMSACGVSAEVDGDGAAGDSGECSFGSNYSYPIKNYTASKVCSFGVSVGKIKIGEDNITVMPSEDSNTTIKQEQRHVAVWMTDNMQDSMYCLHDEKGTKTFTTFENGTKRNTMEGDGCGAFYLTPTDVVNEGVEYPFKIPGLYAMEGGVFKWDVDVNGTWYVTKGSGMIDLCDAISATMTMKANADEPDSAVGTDNSSSGHTDTYHFSALNTAIVSTALCTLGLW